MKKLFNYILVFSLFFVLKNNVLAVTYSLPDTSPVSYITTSSYSISNTELDDYTYFETYTNADFFNNAYYDDINLCPNPNLCTYLHRDSSVFGYLPNGNPIGYYKTDNYNNSGDGHFYAAVRPYTSSDGTVETETQVSSTNEFIFTFNTELRPDSRFLFRVDFAVKFVFTDSTGRVINDKVTKDIFGNLFVDCEYPTSCNYEIDTTKNIFYITMANVNSSNLLKARIYSINRIGKLLKSAPYDYYLHFNISRSSIVYTNDNDFSALSSNDGLLANTSLSDTYDKINTLPIDFFSNSLFDNVKVNKLTEVLLSPVDFIYSLTSDDYDGLTSRETYTIDNDPFKINFNIFSSHFNVPSGLIFWGRGGRNFKTVQVGSYRSTYTQTHTKLYNFRNYWNVLFGGFLIYLSCVKLFKVTNKALSPTNDEVVSL